jgi:hypothetical protein
MRKCFSQNDFAHREKEENQIREKRKWYPHVENRRMRTCVHMNDD